MQFLHFMYSQHMKSSIMCFIIIQRRFVFEYNTTHTHYTERTYELCVIENVRLATRMFFSHAFINLYE